MKALNSFSFLFFFSILLIFACDKDEEPVNPEVFDIVEVKIDEDYWDTTDAKTYYLIDSIRWMQNDAGAGNANPLITRRYDNAILMSIEENMDALGYSRVESLDTTNLPDLIIVSQALATTFVDVDFIYDVWYDWWYFYDPYFPGGVYPIYYQWTEGTVLVEIADTKSIKLDEEEIGIKWIAGINGFVRDSQQGNIDFINTKLDEAFAEYGDLMKSE